MRSSWAMSTFRATLQLKRRARLRFATRALFRDRAHDGNARSAAHGLASERLSRASNAPSLLQFAAGHGWPQVGGRWREPGDADDVGHDAGVLEAPHSGQSWRLRSGPRRTRAGMPVLIAQARSPCRNEARGRVETASAGIGSNDAATMTGGISWPNSVLSAPYTGGWRPLRRRRS